MHKPYVPSIQLSQLQQARIANIQTSAKAIRYQQMARDAAATLQTSYTIGTGIDTYTPTLLRREASGVVHMESKGALLKALVNMYGQTEMYSAIARDILPSVIDALADLHCICLVDIKPFMFKSEVGATTDLTWHRLGFDPDMDAPEVPEYEDMRKRTNQDAFRAQTEFFGSILDYDFMTEQYLHFSGEGNDGKSTLLNAVRSALPRGFAMDMSASALNSSHGTAKIEGRRLLIFSEQNNGSFMSGGMFKQLTGGDPMAINPKGLAEREIVPNCRVIVTSNSKPSVSGGSADMRRIIPVFYESFGDGVNGDTSWQRRMGSKGTAIMSYCYSQYCKNVRDKGLSKITPDRDFTEVVLEMSAKPEMVSLMEK